MTLTVITPSYAPDFELFADLHRSVLRHTAGDVRHVVVVPHRDAARFEAIGSTRLVVLTVESLLARRMVPVPGANAWVNVRHPLPPIRGWVMQQIAKVAAALQCPAGVVLVVDSDVVLVRDVEERTFRDTEDGVVTYRRPGGVTAAMERHVRWHDVARRLLDLPPAPPVAVSPLADYISPLCAWDRRVVETMTQRIGAVAGRPWQDALGAQLHVSEFILYGVHADLVADGEPRWTADSRCHDYWSTTPLDLKGARVFVDGTKDSDVAIMISAKSHTPLRVRRAALKSLVED